STGRSTVDSGAAIMKMMSSTSMTSIKGVTLMSCASPNSSPSPSRSPRTAAIALLRGAHQKPVARPVEIARQQPPNRAGAAADIFQVGFGGAREVVVDDHGRDRGDEPDRRRQQR